MRYAALSDRLNALGGNKWAVHIAGRQRAAAGDDLIFLSIGEPDLAPPPAVVERAIASLRSGRTRYSPAQGEPGELAAIADHLTRRSGGLVTSPDQVVATAGSQHGLFAAISTLAESGDEVLVPDPYYATYDAVVIGSGATLVPVPTYPEANFHVTAEAVEAAVTPRSRVLLLNSPANPTGAVLSVDEIDVIGEVCERHDLWIVSDEVYAPFTFDRSFVSPFDRPRLRDRSAAVASISKSHALPGFRAGWVAGPAELARRITLLCEAMMFGTQPFLADAVVTALSDEHAVVGELRRTFHERALTIVDALDGSPALHLRPRRAACS